MKSLIRSNAYDWAHGKTVKKITSQHRDDLVFSVQLIFDDGTILRLEAAQSTPPSFIVAEYRP